MVRKAWPTPCSQTQQEEMFSAFIAGGVSWKKEQNTGELSQGRTETLAASVQNKEHSRGEQQHAVWRVHLVTWRRLQPRSHQPPVRLHPDLQRMARCGFKANLKCWARRRVASAMLGVHRLFSLHVPFAIHSANSPSPGRLALLLPGPAPLL